MTKVRTIRPARSSAPVCPAVSAAGRRAGQFPETLVRDDEAAAVPGRHHTVLPQPAQCGGGHLRGQAGRPGHLRRAARPQGNGREGAHPALVGEQGGQRGHAGLRDDAGERAGLVG
nr:hypothetical protein [Streptomyces sp. alain-838]